MRLYLGRHRTHPETPPAPTSCSGVFHRPEETRRPRRLLPLHAAQVMFQMRGDYWKVWNDRLRPCWKPRGFKPGR